MDMKVTLSDDLKTLICSKCGIEKLTSGFYIDKSKSSGFHKRCKCCTKLYQDDNKVRKSGVDKKWYESNKIKKYELGKKWNEVNKDLKRSHASKRRAAKLKAFPKWVDQAELNLIADLYTEAKFLENQDNIKRHLDHIHPLQHDLVCGLHCLSNLQILTASENLSKSNKFEPYVESDLDKSNLKNWEVI